MKILETIRKNLNASGFKANDTILNRYNVWAILVSTSAIASHIAYILYEVNTVDEYMRTIFMLTVGCAILMSFLTMVVRKGELNNLIDNFQAIITEVSKNSASKVKYDETNELVEKLSKIFHFLVTKVFIPGFALPKAIFCLFIYISTDLGADAFELSIPLWLPFNWRHPLGFLVAVFLQIIAVIFPFRYLSCFITFALGSYLFVSTLTNDVVNYVKSINDDAKKSKSKIDIYKKLSELVHLHSDGKQLIGRFSKLFEISITILFTTSCIVISIALLQIHVEISCDAINSVVLLESIGSGLGATSIVFFASEAGQRFSIAFFQFENMANILNWYSFPNKVQRILPLIIFNVQQPIEIKFFGSAVCGREQFKKVVNTVYSYYMLLSRI